jgi:hypothetical protein
MTRLEELTNELKYVNTQIYKEMIKSLHENDCRVVFRKQSTGEEREMICTLREAAIPQATKSDALSQAKVRTLNEEVIAAWDVEKQGWRSFRVDSVISFSHK